MNMPSDTLTTTAPRATLSTRERRKRDLRRARTFFLIALMAALVSFAGHCLPGDSPANVSQTETQSSAPGR